MVLECDFTVPVSEQKIRNTSKAVNEEITDCGLNQVLCCGSVGGSFWVPR